MLDRSTSSEPVTPSQHHESLDHSVISLSEIRQFLGRHRVLLAISVLAALSLAIMYCLIAKSVYTAQLQLLIDPQTPQPIQQVVPNGALTYDNPQVESQIAVLRSDTIARNVANEAGLLKDPEFGGVADLPTDAPGKTLLMQRVVANLQNSLDVRREGLSYAINVSISSNDPDKAAKIANAYGSAFIRDQLSARANAVREGSDWLEDRINSIRKQMNEADLKVQEFKMKRDYRIPPPGTDDRTGKDAGDQTSIDELQATAATYRRIYESFLQAYTESVQRQSFPVSNARIISAASRPLVRSQPKTKLILILATVIGLLVGLGLSILMERIGPTGRRHAAG